MSKRHTIMPDLVVGADAEDSYVLFLGGDFTNPSWDEYLDGCEEDRLPYIRGIREWIEVNGHVGATGKQTDDWAFKFPDGEVWAFTWRAWGDLMQAIVNKREGYMRYYM